MAVKPRTPASNIMACFAQTERNHLPLEVPVLHELYHDPQISGI